MPMSCVYCLQPFVWTAAEQAASGYWVVWPGRERQAPQCCPSCGTGTKRIRERPHWTQTPEGAAYFQRRREARQRPAVEPCAGRASSVISAAQPRSS
jgi:hypothetical protein